MKSTLVLIVVFLVLASLIGYEIWAWIQNYSTWKKAGKQYFIMFFPSRILSSTAILLVIIYVVLALTEGNIPAVKNLGISTIVLLGISVLINIGNLISAGYHYHKEKNDKS